MHVRNNYYTATAPDGTGRLYVPINEEKWSYGRAASVTEIAKLICVDAISHLAALILAILELSSLFI